MISRISVCPFRCWPMMVLIARVGKHEALLREPIHELGVEESGRNWRCLNGAVAPQPKAPRATFVADPWYKHGMARVRVSTTVDEQLLATARQTRSGLTDSALIDEALAALLARNRAREVDTAYAAYDRLPLDA